MMYEKLHRQTLDCSAGNTMYGCQILNTLRKTVENEILARQKNDGGATM
ncbi:MAG: hypothetical protein MJ060_02730 [Clostridia bacterium]|nr:hypothetical protein [Clostridia bacterium]